MDAAVIIANTPTDWAGFRWTQLVSPIPDEAAKRNVLIAHEMFHRIQSELGLTRPEAANHHLDSFDGRYLLQLEWRALARALAAETDTDRRTAIEDALSFRHERYRLFPDAAAQEGALEINEGIAEYTGVKLGLTSEAEQTAFAVHDLSAFLTVPTFVRSFAYATGPAYGLLLDRANPAWKSRIGEKRFDELLVDAGYKAQGDAVAARAARYDDGSLRASEIKRDAERRARLADLKGRLVDGPVLILPLAKSSYQFNPQTLIPLEGFGTVYPTMRLNDDWGSLEVEAGGALVYGDGSRATVTAKGANSAGGTGSGWKLTLKPGWSLQPGERTGDLIARKAAP
ncbi:MAG: hypothetical protein EON94_14010 [Caulobacteraceae bacterium]|nr:MAG: hypothetical protein EON94_14010 [Caulobacteraceae bacterium]